MRKQNQEITDQNLIDEILLKSEICRIAMIDNGRPYIVPFNYGYKNNCIYIHSAPVGKKIELIQENNNVCFEIEHKAEIVKHSKACKWSTIYRSVVGYGEVEIITDNAEKRAGLDIIMAHYGRIENNIYDERQLDLMVILKLKITEITGKQSSNFSTG